MSRWGVSARWKKIVDELNQNQTTTSKEPPAPAEENAGHVHRTISVCDNGLEDVPVSTSPLVPPTSEEDMLVSTSLLVPHISKEDVLGSTSPLVPPISEEDLSVSTSPLMPPISEEDLPVSTSPLAPPISEENLPVSISPLVAPISENDESQTDADKNTTSKANYRSLSLSDLTEDTKNEFKLGKKSYSVPDLHDDRFNFVDSSTVAIFYAAAMDEYHDFPTESIDEPMLETVSCGDMDEGRKRRHVAKPSVWKRNKAKRLRMRGEEYLGYRKPQGEKLQHDKIRPARELRETCTSDYCEKSKFRGCSRFTEEIRKQIHSNFWKNMSWDQRKIYVNGLVKRSTTTQKTKTSDEDSRRQGTLSYFLPITKDKENIQVCRTMFLNTLSLGSFMVQSWVKDSSFGMTPDKETLNESRQLPIKPGNERKIHTLNYFFDNLPKLPSHYARKDSTKLFIEPSFHSLKNLFDAYQNYCTLNEEPQVCRFTFEKTFHEKNLSLYTLKKDMCDVCSSYKAGNLSQAEHQIHTFKKDRARLEKAEDKKKSDNGEFILLTLDLEAVKVCPFLTASALYFKTKLVCHNYTVYNLASHHCTCYWFDETAADLTSSTFTSFLIDYLERHCLAEDKKPIVIFSDGCTYQNRNVTLSNALLLFSQKHEVTITQKFLEPGHTQMECDSVHSAIERKLKNREIHLPSDYLSVTKEARANPYEVVDVDYDFVKNYADPNTWVYKSIRPGRKPGDPQVVDIRAIQYKPDLQLKIKLGFDDDWMELPQRQKLPGVVNYRQLNTSRLPIQATKYNHLQQLKSVLPRDCHNFYDTLPYLP